MGNFVSVSASITVVSALIAGLIAVFLEQINQKLELLEAAVIGRRKVVKGNLDVRMIGWLGTQIETWEKIWGHQLEPKKSEEEAETPPAEVNSSEKHNNNNKRNNFNSLI